MGAYEVFFIDSDGTQKSAGRFRYFRSAQAIRDDRISQGYEAWIEDTTP